MLIIQNYQKASRPVARI